MYIYMDEDGVVTQSDEICGYILIGDADLCSWPRVVKVEIYGLDMTAKAIGLGGKWKDIPVEPPNS